LANTVCLIVQFQVKISATITLKFCGYNNIGTPRSARKLATAKTLSIATTVAPTATRDA
jgi:hypothetical protein